ncbi:DUF5689 domain-containing protein [Chitinophaga sp. 30R24]|uniref:DUF5689 domain-containing protein n=1 Tax=Chitinophaga sp. 30R24 TaxID=3248838 RepID=UPI003B8FB621
MKKLIIASLFLPLLAFLWGCEKDSYPGGVVSPYISIYDVKNLYKGNDVTLNKDNMLGSHSLAAVVVSDHSDGNLPAGLLVVQDARRLSTLRGISIPLGDAAAQYVPGDSLLINIEGGVLKRVNGILEITGVKKEGITKVAANVTIPVNRINAGQILANPDAYESTLGVIVKGGFDPLPAPGEKLGGDKTLNDGFGNIDLHTEAVAPFADSLSPVSANYYGITFNTTAGDKLVPQFRMRTSKDFVVLSSVIEIAPVLITGFMSDVKGGDGNYEYVQMMATKDIDFTVTPYAVVICNNANASTPTGYPAKGWATGDMRTFKLSLIQGKVTKGQFFYAGGAGKMINGASSTSMTSSVWARAFDYTKTGGDGFGAATSGLMANSGNAFGMAVFSDSAVTEASKPVDVIFISTGGSLYTAGPPEKGYRIANNDWYDIINPITLQSQPFYRCGSNTIAMIYNTADLGYFNMLGGEYNPALGKWSKARTQTNVLLTKTSALSEIEGEGATQLK